MTNEGEELSESDVEAQADAAPVDHDLAYRRRKAWRPGNCAGFIINTSIPVARLAWPKGREAKEFLARIKSELGKMPPAYPAQTSSEVTIHD